MSDATTCISCGLEKDATQFLESPARASVGKCIQCLPKTAEGFSCCEKCRVRKRNDSFPMRRGGRRSRICGPCFPRKRRFKICNTCGEEKPMADFGALVQPSGSIRRRAECSACFVPAIRSKICVKCGERLSLEQFVGASYSKPDGSKGFRRSSVCESCSEQKKPPPQRECRACHVRKPIDQFRKLVGGGRTHRCCACPPNGEGNRQGHRLRQLCPCLHCGDEIWTSKPDSRVRDVKYCSRYCSKLGRRLQERHCDQCQELLPSEEFEPPKPGKSRVVWRCKQCAQDIREGRTLAKPGCSTPANVMRNLRYRAEKEGVPMKVSYRQVRAVLAEDCCFCGADADTVAPFDPSKTIDAANLRGLCAPCRQFVTPRTVHQVAAFVRAAAANLPKAATPRLVPRPHRRKERLEPPPPSGLRRSDMVPLEVHGAPVAGETWEQRVARYAKPQGPWSSKKKTADEDI